MSRPRLLLVNDDGIGAIGLQKLKTAADSVSDDVWTVAPAAERSGRTGSSRIRVRIRAGCRTGGWSCGTHSIPVSRAPTWPDSWIVFRA